MKLKALDYFALKIVLALATSCLVAHAAQHGDFMHYEQGAGITISGYTGPGGVVAIPDAIEGKPVARISDRAFSGHVGLTSVTIPNSTTSIGYNAFSACTGLTSVTLPENVTTIVSGAFSGCTSLTNFSVDPLNPAFSSLDGVLFNRNQTVLLQYPAAKIANYVIPESVKIIDSPAFSGSSGLRSVTIHGSLEWAYWFYDCTGLTNVTILKGVVGIESYAFANCTALASVSIPDSVTSIGDEAFSGCGALVSVTIPDSVTYIGNEAFRGCSTLVSVNIPASVTELYLAFEGCSSLESIVVDPLNGSYSSLDGVLFNKDQTYLLKFPEGKAGNYRVPNGVVGFRSFSGCTRLSSVTIGMGGGGNPGLFNGCPSLRSIYFLGNAPSGFWYGDEISRTWVPFGFNLTGSDRATVFHRAGTTGWEGLQFGGRPAVLWVPTDDLDNDWMDNQEEMLAGTDPLDATSWLAFEGAPRPGALAEEDQTPTPIGQHPLYFQSIPGMRYEILSSDVLGGAWASAATVDASALQKRVLVDRPASAAFYQIKVLP